jgi:peptidoglycan lytic transglycosylase
MKRWIVVLSLAVALSPDIAAAAPSSMKSKSVSRSLSVRPHHAARVEAAATAHAFNAFIEPAAEAPRPAVRAPRRRKFDSASYDCGGGRRIISAYYWEGRHTASGQRFNPYSMTAAHRTLPFGTQLTVSNPRTGKSVNVIINDRGPYTSGVSLDLSLGAAQAIGMRGTGPVCLL